MQKPGTYRQDGGRDVELRTVWWHVVVLDFAFETMFEPLQCD